MKLNAPRVLIVHPDLLYCQLLAKELSVGGRIEQTDYATTPVAAAAKLTEHHPTALVVQWDTVTHSTPELIRVALQQCPQLCVIVIGINRTAFPEQLRDPRCTVLSLDSGLRELLSHIPGTQVVYQDPYECLTFRQREIAHLIDSGLSNKEIAKKLNLSLHTVKNHIHNMLAKLELETRQELARLAHKNPRLAPIARPQIDRSLETA